LHLCSHLAQKSVQKVASDVELLMPGEGCTKNGKITIMFDCEQSRIISLIRHRNVCICTLHVERNCVFIYLFIYYEIRTQGTI